MPTTWIIAPDASIGNLLELAKEQPGNVTVLALGWQTASIEGVDNIVAVPVPEKTPLEAVAPCVIDLMAVEADDLIFAPTSSVGRVIAGAVAAQLNIPVIQNVIKREDDLVVYERYGGIIAQSMRVLGPALVLANGGSEVTSQVESVEAPADKSYKACVTETKVSERSFGDLLQARRVVSCGRGFSKQEDLDLARDLAAVIDAELACTRPIAEGLRWMPKETYVGVTGLRLAPDLFFAVGTSGQLQHMYGCQDARIVVAVNNDSSAPVFSCSDYGIVGDLKEVLPCLSDALK